MKINKINAYSNVDCKIIENNTMYSVQELHLYIFWFLVRIILASFTSSAVSIHSLTNLSTNIYLHLQFS